MELKPYFCILLITVVSLMGIAFIGGNQQFLVQGQQNQTSEELNKKHALSFPTLEEEIENEIDRAIADEALIHHDKILNKEYLQNVSDDFEDAFPDWKAKPEVIVAEDDFVAVLWTGNGTHQGEYLGIPPTQKEVTLKMAEFMKISNGTVTEYWVVPDATDLLIDIGYLIPQNGTKTINMTG